MWQQLIGGNWHFKYWLLLFINGILLENYRIKKEAFDTLTRGLVAVERTGVEIYTIANYQPVAKVKKVVAKKVVEVEKYAGKKFN